MNSLKEARLNAGFKIRGEAAARLGINRDVLGRYERGQFEPTLSTLIKMAEVYGCSMDELVGRTKATA